MDFRAWGGPSKGYPEPIGIPSCPILPAVRSSLGGEAHPAAGWDVYGHYAKGDGGAQTTGNEAGKGEGMPGAIPYFFLSK